MSIEAMKLMDPHDHPEPHTMKWTQAEMDYINNRVETAVRQAIEQAQKHDHQAQASNGLRDAMNRSMDIAKQAQPEIKQDRHELQAKGEHPAPCARFCEANAFQIEIRSLKAKLEQAEKQEPAVRFKIYKPTVPDPVRQGINNALLPWVYDQDRSSGFDASMWVTPVATLPPQRQPLTITEIREGRDTADPSGEDVCAWSFAKGVQWAETKHGITGEQK